MKLPGYQKRLVEHQAKVQRLESTGEMAKIYKSNPRLFRKLYHRLGYLQQKVESLQQSYIA